jgi:DinB family protein
MSKAPANPRVEAIRLSVQRSYAQLMDLIDGPLEALDPQKLYVAPAAGEWSIQQNLAHIAEFMPYWANEISRLLAHPGQNFGRTQQDAGRLRALEEHGRDSLAQDKESMPHSYARLQEVLGRLQDNDLRLRAHHVKFGEKSLDWFIDDFVTQHLSDHLEQIKMALAAVSA